MLCLARSSGCRPRRDPAGGHALHLPPWRRPPTDARARCFRCSATRAIFLFIHFRRSFERAQPGAARSGAPRHQRLSRAHHVLPRQWSSSASTNPPPRSTPASIAKGIQPYSDEWKQEIEATLDRHRQAMAPRLWPEIPATKYACFYPMDRRRGESKNWYRGIPGGPPANDGKARRNRPPLRRRSAPDHFRIHRPGRLGVGRRPLLRRPAGVQAPHLRDALRRSQRSVRALRFVLRGRARSGRRPRGIL